MDAKLNAISDVGECVVSGPAGEGDFCPICGAGVQRQPDGFWRCSQDITHYWLWRGEQNGGAIRRFLTQPHPNKEGAFYKMTVEEREAFLEEARRRMQVGGYTLNVSEVSKMYQHERMMNEEMLVGLSAEFDGCAICKAPIPADGPPLCTICEEDLEQKWDDYRAEQEQARRPL